MKPANYHPLARSEMIDSALFYESRRRELGERFLEAVKTAEGRVRKNPLLGRTFEAGTRKIRVKIFPFSLSYKERPDHIFIYAVAHLSRRPGYWMERL